MEVAFTLTLVLLVGLVLAYAFFPTVRSRLISLLPPLGAAT